MGTKTASLHVTREDDFLASPTPLPLMALCCVNLCPDGTPLPSLRQARPASGTKEHRKLTHSVCESALDGSGQRGSRRRRHINRRRRASQFGVFVLLPSPFVSVAACQLSGSLLGVSHSVIGSEFGQVETKRCMRARRVTRRGP